MNIVRKSVALLKDNVKYIEEVGKLQKIKSFSRVLNEVINERRLNEEFDSCQNEF